MVNGWRYIDIDYEVQKWRAIAISLLNIYSELEKINTTAQHKTLNIP